MKESTVKISPNEKQGTNTFTNNLIVTTNPIHLHHKTAFY